MFRRILGFAVAICAALAGPAKAFNPLDAANAYDYVVLTHDNFAIEAANFVTLHPSLRSCLVKLSEVQAAFPGATTVDKIRAFTAYAYQNWKIAPTYLLLVGDANIVEPQFNFLPTFVAHNPYYTFDNVDWYAYEGYYVTSAVPGQIKPVMHLGRIPARTSQQVTTAYTKMNQYQQIVGSPAWLQRILMLVGNAHINEFPGQPPNATWWQFNDQLHSTEFSSWNQPNITTIFAEPLANQGFDRTAISRDAWNSGYGLVNALGNTQDPSWLVFMAYFNLPGYLLGDGNPTFTESLASTSYLPVVYGNTCFTNWFHRNTELSVGEDLLLSDPAKGAVAVIGPTHVADMVETYAMNKTFAHELVTNGVRNLGRLYSTAQSRFITEQQGHRVFADEYCLLGDPALDLKLGSIPNATAFRNGIEIEDMPALQDRVISKTADITGDNVRVVNEAPGVVALQGERMLRVSLNDAAGTPGLVEWKIQDLNLPITQNMVLSFWMNMQSSPSGNGKLVLDGNSSFGRIRDRLDIFDQTGTRLDAKVRGPAGPGWRFYYADLSPLRGGTLQDLRLRYETTSSSDAGALLAYVDDIRVERYESVQSQELVNHSFEEDVDSDGTPDFWTDLIGVPNTFNAIRRNTFVADGNYSMVVQDVYANGGGAKQVFTANVEAWAYTMEFRYYAPEATSVRVRIRDLETGTTISEILLSASPLWRTATQSFSNPHYGSSPARFSFEVLPQDPLRSVYIDDVNMSPPAVVDVRGNPVTGLGKDARLLGVAPNPSKLNGSIRIGFSLPRESEVEIGIFDPSGRRLGGVGARTVGAGSHWITPELLGSGMSTRSPGLCFVRLRVDGVWITRAEKAVVLQ